MLHTFWLVVCKLIQPCPSQYEEWSPGTRAGKVTRMKRSVEVIRILSFILMRIRILAYKKRLKKP
jgi:hypothetical protein